MGEEERGRSGVWARLTQYRSWVQVASLLITNSYFTQQVTKGFPCLALNCYACPLAATACPIGSIQHFVELGQVPWYVLGVMGLAGALGGRFACGWLCPFGWLQELLHKVPLPKWRVQPRQRARWWVLLAVTLPYAGGAWAILRLGVPWHLLFAFYLVAGFVLYAFLGASRYFALLGLVFLLPNWAVETWFCRLCPAGMLEGGIPQVLLEPALREFVGSFYWLKLVILVLFVVWMIATRRPFCRWICPLGALWSPFNRWSTLQMAVDRETCIRCDRCQQVCPVDIRIYQDANAGACIRCMRCTSVCPVQCIHVNGE
jgi:ferredoxin-type protein NapH